MEKRRVGYIGEGAFSKRLPYADFFGYFLVRRQESNITALSYIKVYISSHEKRPLLSGLFY